jgi:hypothetical protein
MASNDETYIDYPNRRKASSKTTKAVVVLLMIVTAVLMTIVTIGGWERIQGARAIQIGYIALFLICAFYIARWRSGLLPVAAALAIILLIFAAVSGPQWFDRAKEGFTPPAIDDEILGMLTLLIVPVQVLLIAFAMSGFRQDWQVEVERRVEDRPPDDDGRSRGGTAAATA